MVRTILPSNLAYAADLHDHELLHEIIKEIHPFIGVVKLGPVAVLSPYFAEILALIDNLGLQVFLDMKFHDIPNTVALAIKAANRFSSIATIHLSGGEHMLQNAIRAKNSNLRVIGVTCLTSDKNNNDVMALAQIAKNVGLDGVVCSGLEVEKIKDFWPDCFAVTPGIRLASDTVDDQERIVTPRQAIDGGSDLLVIGRPITRAQNRTITMRRILAS